MHKISINSIFYLNCCPKKNMNRNLCSAIWSDLIYWLQF